MVGHRYWLVMVLNKTANLSIGGREIQIPLNFADGMIGAIPVFESQEAAVNFAGKEYKVMPLRVEG